MIFKFPSHLKLVECLLYIRFCAMKFQIHYLWFLKKITHVYIAHINIFVWTDENSDELARDHIASGGSEIQSKSKWVISCFLSEMRKKKKKDSSSRFLPLIKNSHNYINSGSQILNHIRTSRSLLKMYINRPIPCS